MKVGPKLTTFRYNIRNPLNRIIREIEIVGNGVTSADKKALLYKKYSTTEQCKLDRVCMKMYPIGAYSTLQHRSNYTYGLWDIEQYIGD